MTLTRREALLAGGTMMAGLTANSMAYAELPEPVIEEHFKRIKPLELTANRAWWVANTSGKDEDFKAKEDAQNKIDAALADKAMFARIKALYDGRHKYANSETVRQLELLYLQYLEKQVSPDLLRKITSKANAVEQAFNVYRPNVDGQELSDSQVRETLKKSTDSRRRQSIWEASKGVGKNVEADLKELVVLRNQAAKELGFANFHVMMLTLNEQTTDGLFKLFDDLDELTKGPFTAAKAEIDEKLAKSFGIKPADLMPWHYHDPFFQESPTVFDADLDLPYKTADILDLCRRFYRGVNLPIERVLERSDLYEKKGKSPHAFCTDIDRDGDVRVLANIVPNEYWMGTMLHELGHSVYSSLNIPATRPYLLRGEAHILTTEGVAMQFERFSKSRAWLEKMGVNVADGAKFDAAAKKVQRNQLLIFSRWCQVMLRFEKGMYENPNQDLNALWWSLVEKYQQVKKPAGRNAPDYASKIHICSAPVYYHNYMMGQLFASQVHHAMAKDLNGGDVNGFLYIDNPKVGEWMTRKVFAMGRLLPWNDLTKFATGAHLSAEAFAKDFRG
jgi:peptidyl-dipeptidase A